MGGSLTSPVLQKFTLRPSSSVEIVSESSDHTSPNTSFGTARELLRNTVYTENAFRRFGVEADHSEQELQRLIARREHLRRPEANSSRRPGSAAGFFIRIFSLCLIWV